MSNLIRTTVQLKPEIVHDLKAIYPALTISQIIRLCCEYTLARQPQLERGRDLLVDIKIDKTKTSPKVVHSIGPSNGGLARAAKLSPERRKQIATDAAYKRWNKPS